MAAQCYRFVVNLRLVRRQLMNVCNVTQYCAGNSRGLEAMVNQGTPMRTNAILQIRT